jgi:hypothetical protein
MMDAPRTRDPFGYAFFFVALVAAAFAGAAFCAAVLLVRAVTFALRQIRHQAAVPRDLAGFIRWSGLAFKQMKTCEVLAHAA